MSTFVIQHRSGRKYIHPESGMTDASDGTHLVIHEDMHEYMHWTIEPIDGPWGYIKQVVGDKIWHPITGSMFPDNGTLLVLHGDRHSGALFALDEVNDCIVHKGGKFVHPQDGSPNPRNGMELVLHSDRHDAMRFEFLSPSNTDKKVSVYGKPQVNGSWKIISTVLNPLAEHTYRLEYKLGKSKTESITSQITFTWETSVGAKTEFLEASTTASFSSMIEKSSSATWSEETKVTREIKVRKGESVVTWQFIFAGEQLGTKATFFSNILADTRSPDIEPEATAGFPH